MRRSTTALTLATLTGLFAHALPARAQDNAAAVETLFSAGKKLMSEGKISEACPKFLASYNLEHRLGTLLNLADCYERTGQLASAWARFVEAATLAQRANQGDRATFAADHAKSLEPRLSTLVVAVAAPNAAPGLAVTRDGIAVDPGAYGVALAVDGGTHHVVASAPGMKSWSGDVVVQPSGDHPTLSVPALAPLPVAAVAVTDSPSGSPTRRYVGIGTAALGVVVVGVGAVFGVVAINKNHDAAPDCGLNGLPNDCNGTGVDLRHTAVTDGTLSTVFVGVGAAAVVGGAVLWLTGGPFGAKTTVGFDGHSVQLAGSF